LGSLDLGHWYLHDACIGIGSDLGYCHVDVSNFGFEDQTYKIGAFPFLLDAHITSI